VRTNLRLAICTLSKDGGAPPLEAYMDEFSNLVKQPPMQIGLQVQRIEHCDTSRILDLTSPESVYEITDHVGGVLATKYGHTRTILWCDPCHVFAKTATAALRHARWGVTNGLLALVYGTTDKYAIWHECLHLLGAQDCYDTSDPQRNAGPTCDVPTCIMQYAPMAHRVGSWPFLCESNVRRIKSALSH
jgi:hypothetical protein